MTNMDMEKMLSALSESGNLRNLPDIVHDGRYVVSDGRRMLNLSSNDYLGIASDGAMMAEFAGGLQCGDILLSSSSSRLLTGNHKANAALENRIAQMYGAESAIVFGSGYHMNAGILPAVSDSHTLIIADKLVHASIIDGMRLSYARQLRYRHQDLDSLERLVYRYKDEFNSIIIVTESIFSMDGDVTDLQRLVDLKKSVPAVMLYVDEAHAVGVRGRGGLGVAEESGCVGDIDFLCGTFGKALASVGAFTVCSSVVKRFLVNKMRTLIFTTALPPLNLMWSLFVMERLPELYEKRKALDNHSAVMRNALVQAGLPCPSSSHIIPVTVGESTAASAWAEHFQREGFYLLPVRPPTVPEGTSRLRISLTSSISAEELSKLVSVLNETISVAEMAVGGMNR